MNEIIAEIGKAKYQVRFISQNEVLINDIKYQIDLSKFKNDLFKLSINGRQHQLHIIKIGTGLFHSTIEGEEFTLKLQTKLESEANKLLKKNVNDNSNKKITAPMNGLIVKVNKEVGEKVEFGDSLLILEAMKMENEIKSPSDGVIKTNNCKIGKSINKGELLFIIE